MVIIKVYVLPVQEIPFPLDQPRKFVVFRDLLVFMVSVIFAVVSVLKYSCIRFDGC